jgi:hypothetical protein
MTRKAVWPGAVTFSDHGAAFAPLARISAGFLLILGPALFILPALSDRWSFPNIGL